MMWLYVPEIKIYNATVNWILKPTLSRLDYATYLLGWDCVEGWWLLDTRTAAVVGIRGGCFHCFLSSVNKHVVGSLVNICYKL